MIFSADDIFISDGLKCDTGNIQEISAVTAKLQSVTCLSRVCRYDCMSGKTGQCRSNGYYDGIVYLPCTRENGFIPELPRERPDLIFLCYPNNPTGTVATREELKKWVDYAEKNRSIILYDAAYEAFITEEDIPHPIYEIEGARKLEIEFRSF